MSFILKNNLLALALIYFIPFLCFSIFGEKYEGEGDFLSVSFTSFFFYTPGLVIQLVLMTLCNYIFKGKNKYVSFALILLLSIDLLFTIFSLFIFGNMKTPHSSIGDILHILITDTLYWTLSLIVCKICMFVRLLLLYCREKLEDVM